MQISYLCHQQMPLREGVIFGQTFVENSLGGIPLSSQVFGFTKQIQRINQTYNK